MLAENEKIHFKISKQKLKIQFLAYLRKFTKKTFYRTKCNLGNQNIGIFKLNVYFSNTQNEIFAVKPPF